MLSFPRALAAITVGVALSVVVVWELIAPVKLEVADRYRQRGDAYLVGQDFESAQAEYDKALHYDPGNALAGTNLALAKEGTTDPAALRSFYAAHSQSGLVARIDDARQTYDAPKKALEAGVALYANGDASYARYPIEQATELDPEYPEAWHYLGLVYDQLAKEDASYRSKAEEAWKKRDALTNAYMDTQN